MGEIAPSLDPSQLAAAQDSIRCLHLDAPELNASRHAALDGALAEVDTMTDEDLRKLLAAYAARDAQGRYVPFCQAIIHVLQGLLPRPVLGAP